MARLPLCSKLIKNRKSRLVIRVRRAESFDTPKILSKSCATLPNRIHLTFIKHMRKRYVNSSSSSLIGEVQMFTKDITMLCQDRRKCFNAQSFSHAHSYISKNVLECLDIKKDLHDKIIAKVMRCGHKMNKKKDFKGLVVILTVVQTFLGDQLSIHRAMEESDPERAELNDDEYVYI